MKELLNKAKNKITNMSTRCKREVAALSAVTATLMPMNVFADEAALMKNILDVIVKIFRYIGILLLAWSIGMLVLAFKNEDADSKSRAMMLLVVSVVLIAIEGILDAVGVSGLI